MPDDVFAKVLNFAPGKSGEEITNHYNGMMAQLVSNNYVELSAVDQSSALSKACEKPIGLS